MRFGIKRQLLVVCVVTVAAVAAVGLVGRHAAKSIRERARVGYVDYTVALRDLAAAGGEFMTVGELLERAHTPGVAQPAQHAAIDAAAVAVDKLVGA